MEDNLLVGDHLLVNKFAFGSRGSILDAALPFVQEHPARRRHCLHRYPKDLTKHYVKRAIGLPGDHVKIVDKQVFVNGQALWTNRIRFTKPRPVPTRIHFGISSRPSRIRTSFITAPKRIPTGTRNSKRTARLSYLRISYFAMGDNRDNSSDSRYWGFVPRDLIVGKGLIIYWSYETDSDEYRQTAIGDRFHQVTDLVTNFFKKTRWSRTLKVIR